MLQNKEWLAGWLIVVWGSSSATFIDFSRPNTYYGYDDGLRWGCLSPSPPSTLPLARDLELWEVTVEAIMCLSNNLIAHLWRADFVLTVYRFRILNYLKGENAEESEGRCVGSRLEFS